MSENNGEKLVFELKDLSYSDLINLYRDLLDFNSYVDSTINEISEVNEEGLPSPEGNNTPSEGTENASEGNNTPSEGTDNSNEISSDQNNSEVKTESSNEEAK